MFDIVFNENHKWSIADLYQILFTASLIGIMQSIFRRTFDSNTVVYLVYLTLALISAKAYYSLNDIEKSMSSIKGAET